MEAKTQQTSAQDCLQRKQDSNQNQTGVPKMRQVSYQKLLIIISIYIRNLTEPGTYPQLQTQPIFFFDYFQTNSAI